VAEMFPHPNPGYKATDHCLTAEDNSWMLQELQTMQPNGLQWLLGASAFTADPVSVLPTVPIIRDLLLSEAYRLSSDKDTYVQEVLNYLEVWFMCVICYKYVFVFTLCDMHTDLRMKL
jgi:hypothetical protein